MSLLLDLPDDILGFVLALASIGAPELTFGTRPYVESCESDQPMSHLSQGARNFIFFRPSSPCRQFTHFQRQSRFICVL
jgi:hypothetical protein